MNKPFEAEGVERFTVFFKGPKPLVPQSTYSLSHEGMGTIDIFLVPIGADGDGFLYERYQNWKHRGKQQPR